MRAHRSLLPSSARAARLPLALLLCATAAPAWAAAPSPLVNPSFEAGDLEGWRIEVGAGNAATGGPSVVAVVDSQAAQGKRSLELSGGSTTSQWSAVWQDLAVSGADEVALSFSAKTDRVRREGHQHHNANGLIAFFDASGARLSLDATGRLVGSQPWQRLSLVTPVPRGATRASVGVLLSESGTMWVDDVRVRVRHLAPWSPAASGGAWAHLVERAGALYPFANPAAGRRDLEARAARLREQAAAAKTRDDFAAAAVELLAPLQDVHVALVAGGRPVPTYVAPEPVSAWNFDAVKARVKRGVLGERGYSVAELEGGVAYAHLATWQRGEAPVKRVLAALDELKDARGVIIDVRGNQGGAEAVAALLAGRFARERTVYAEHRFRVGDGWGPWQQRTIGPSAAPDLRPVVVLQGPWCMSSNEGFLQMMRALPTVTTVGLPSRGASRNPVEVRLTEDVTAVISRWENALPDGTLTEGVGVPPEVLVDAPAAAYARRDPMLERALELLR